MMQPMWGSVSGCASPWDEAALCTCQIDLTVRVGTSDMLGVGAAMARRSVRDRDRHRFCHVGCMDVPQRPPELSGFARPLMEEEDEDKASARLGKDFDLPL
ncbi:hypothetical protein NL676_023534 [Syzygium grande]|nr:hypothetical protein NL676_023534 [Syzygium grande]